MDVINLVSSDEEDNNGSIKNKISKNKGLTIKRIKPQKPNANKSVQKPSTENNHQPMNNGAVTVIHVVRNNATDQRQQQTPPKPLQQQKQQFISNQTPVQLSSLKQPVKLPVKQPVQQTVKPTVKPTQLKQTTLVISPQKLRDGTIGNQLNLSNSGVTITPIINSHGKPTPPRANLFTPKPTVETVSVAMKPKLSPIINTTVHPVQLIQANQSNKTINAATPRPAKRIHPTKISDAVTVRASSMEKSSDSDVMSRDSSSVANDEAVTTETNGTIQSNQPEAKRRKIVEEQKRPCSEDYVKLLDTFRASDPTKDMEKIISKLEKHYQRAHVEYINSKSFKKLIKDVTERVQAKPTNVYKEINSLVEELKTRRKVEVPSASVTVSDETTDTEILEVDKKKTKQIEELNKALKKLQKRIRECEEAEVDLNDEHNSKFLLMEKYKERAVKIYEKLCDITGESRDAKRALKKPIRFRDTKFDGFNRKLEKFINETKTFPDLFDVLKIIDHCDRQYNYRLSREQRKALAQDAFQKVGTILQKRRKHDLYEMVEYFTGNNSDPAVNDTSLKVKLEENQRYYNKRMNDVIEKFTMNYDESEANDDEKEAETEKRKTPVKQEQRISPVDSPLNMNVPSVSTPAPLIDDTEIIAPDLNIDADIDMLHNSVSFIEENEFENIAQDGELLIEGPEADEELQKQLQQELQQGLHQEAYPMITSVTSLHPEFKFINFDANPLDSSHTTIL